MTRNNPTGSSLISTKDAADRYGVSRRSIHRWAKQDGYYAVHGHRKEAFYPADKIEQSARERGWFEGYRDEIGRPTHSALTLSYPCPVDGSPVKVTIGNWPETPGITIEFGAFTEGMTLDDVGPAWVIATMHSALDRWQAAREDGDV